MRSALVALIILGSSAGALAAPSAIELAHAKELYRAAEAAMASKQYAEAVKDYGAAYDITKEPILFFKIGTAYEDSGECTVALVYFRRYLKEAAPTQKFVDLTNERITACSAPADKPAPPAPPPLPPPSRPTPPAAPDSHAAAWVIAGGSLALVISGVVLGQAARSSENDVRDLYTGLNNTPPTYDAATQKRYEDLLDEGHRYQDLSYAAFGAAAVAGGLSAYLMFRHHGEAMIVPAASPQGASVTARWSF